MLSLVLAMSLSATPDTADVLRLGEPLPRLVLPTLAGQPIDVGAAQGKPTLLIQFASW